MNIQFLADCQEHIPLLASLQYQEISRHWVPNADVAKVQERLEMHANHNALPLTLVATLDGQALGMASLRVNDGIRPDLQPWLGSLVVDPAFRKQKIAEQLIDAIAKQAKARNHDYLYLLAFDPTIPTWYKKLGWAHLGTEIYFGHTVTVMQLNLNKPNPNK